jgi:nicotinamidase-related amidase
MAATDMNHDDPGRPRPTPIAPDAALVIVDMQQGMQDPKLGRRNNPQAEANIARLLSLWRGTLRPVVHIRHMSRSPASVFWPGQPGAQFQPAFAPLAHEHVVEKNVPDAFAATGLERWLRVRGIGEVVVAGVATNNSVESTARSAGNLGFRTVVASDGCFTFDLCDLSGRVWSAEDVHALSLANLATDYAQVLATEEIAAAAGGG